MADPLRVYLVAGEPSGDVLGGALIRALVSEAPAGIALAGVGGEAMTAAGLRSLYPLSDVAVMGLAAIGRRLPTLVRRVHETVADALAFRPDGVVIIDSPEFTHPIARRIRRRLPAVPIIDYVCPSVWAWRPWRARAMRRYVDRVLTLLPFEPDALARLDGPPGTYVGHPMVERRAFMVSRDGEALARRLGLAPGRPVLAVLPGSRRSEVERLMAPFGAAVAGLLPRTGPLEVIVPTVPAVRDLVRAGLAGWPLVPHLVESDDDKFAAFRLARAALAASGTVTLELALAGCPMVVAYRVDVLTYQLRFLIRAPSIVLANLVLGENAFPEFIQHECTPQRLTETLACLVGDTPERQRQLAALARIEQRMRLAVGSPSEAAARAVLETLAAAKGARPA